MRIEVSKQDLVQALDFVNSTASKDDESLTGHYLFRVAPSTTDVIEILSTNNKAVSQARLNCKYTPTEGGVTAFMFSAPRLNQWLSAVPDAALALEHTGGTTTAFSPRGEQKYEAYDASKFPFFDDIREASKPTAKVQATRLRAALQYARPFVHTDEVVKPQLCQIQFRNGLMYATDTSTAVAVQMVGFEEADFSLSGKGIGGLLNFLGNCGDGEIEIREHERMTLFCLGDMAMFAEAPLHQQFPKLALGLDNLNQRVWTLDREEIQGGLKYLLSAAPKGNTHLILNDDNDDNTVQLGMTNATSGTKYIPISCKSKLVNNCAAALPNKGFKVNYTFLQRVLAAQANKEVQIGINVKGVGGWLRFDEVNSEGDSFHAIVQWSN